MFMSIPVYWFHFEWIISFDFVWINNSRSTLCASLTSRKSPHLTPTPKEWVHTSTFAFIVWLMVIIVCLITPSESLSPCVLVGRLMASGRGPVQVAVGTIKIPTKTTPYTSLTLRKQGLCSSNSVDPGQTDCYFTLHHQGGIRNWFYWYSLLVSLSFSVSEVS